jgi:hypothetical protein
MALKKEFTFLLKEETTSLNFILCGITTDRTTTVGKIVFLPTESL